MIADHDPRFAPAGRIAELRAVAATIHLGRSVAPGARRPAAGRLAARLGSGLTGLADRVRLAAGRGLVRLGVTLIGEPAPPEPGQPLAMPPA